MIKESLGSSMNPSNYKSEIMKNTFSEVGKNNITNPGDAIFASSEISKDLGEENIKPQIIRRPFNKKISKNKVDKLKIKTPISKLFSITKEEFEILKNENKINLEEKWSEKYKKSIDCKNPKGFSQKAHCQGRKKKSESKEATGSGSAGAIVGPVGFDPKSDFVKKSFSETPKIEANEATSSASAGSYVTPAAWAKSMKKKDWRGKSKTQIPGGQFVQVKKKCKKFPYCNQGDINALKLTENKLKLKNIITNLSEKYNIDSSIIIDILKREFPKSNKPE